jgi:hypothetical protein
LNQSEEVSCAGITCKECNKINPEGSKMQYNKILLKTCHYLLIGVLQGIIVNVHGGMGSSN